MSQTTATDTKPATDAANKVAEMDGKAIANMAAELIQLRAKVATLTEMEKKPCDDDVLRPAIARLVKEAKEDLAKANPRALPNLSLAKILGFVPDFSSNKSQRKEWNEVRDELRKQYSAKHRELLSVRRAIFAKVSKDPKALISTVANKRADGTYSKVSLSAKQNRKVVAGKGLKKAKPNQVAGKVPAAGNAVNPATVS